MGMTSRERTAQRKQAQAELQAKEAEKAKAARAARPKKPPIKVPRRPRVKKVPIHRPGEDAIYTDEELMDLPPAVLNDDQIKRRTRLIRNRNTSISRAAQRKTRSGPPKTGSGQNREREYCAHIKPNSDQCGAFQAYGTEHCRFHMTPDELAKAGLDAARNTGPNLLGVHSTLTPQQQYRRVLEKAFAVLMNKQLNVFGLELVGFDPQGDPVLEHIPGGGVKIYGESKDGFIMMTEYDDLGAMNKVFAEMQDRVFGKARQALTVEGGAKPIEVKPVRTGDRGREMATLLDQYGIIPGRATTPHSGRTRRTPAKSTEDRHADAVEESKKNGKA